MPLSLLSIGVDVLFKIKFDNVVKNFAIQKT